MKSRNRQNGFVRAVKKFFLSAFVIVTFTAYALENRATTGGAAPAPAQTTTTAAVTPTAGPATARSASAGPASTGSAITGAATAGPASAGPATAAPATSSGYKDGTYTGPTVYVNWGYVQVQATVQNGQVSNVQFLQYPSDRRTSQRINSIADPELDQEAIQAQSANVDIITGATLTSEGFQMSLQAALNQAKS
jgi:uncharacterized protein with FMN-binding domain